jgi:hypothetical protein
MAKATEITTPEIVAEAVAEVAEEVKEAPSSLREKLRELGDIWGRASIQFSQAPKN